jgi:hypothetical protein
VVEFLAAGSRRRAEKVIEERRGRPAEIVVMIFFPSLYPPFLFPFYILEWGWVVLQVSFSA